MRLSLFLKLSSRMHRPHRAQLSFIILLVGFPYINWWPKKCLGQVSANYFTCHITIRSAQSSRTFWGRPARQLQGEVRVIGLAGPQCVAFIGCGSWVGRRNRRLLLNLKLMSCHLSAGRMNSGPGLGIAVKVSNFK